MSLADDIRRARANSSGEAFSLEALTRAFERVATALEVLAGIEKARLLREEQAREKMPNPDPKDV